MNSLLILFSGLLFLANPAHSSEGQKFECSCYMGGSCNILNALQIEDTTQQAQAIELALGRAANQNDLQPLSDFTVELLRNEKIASNHLDSIEIWIRDFFRVVRSRPEPLEQFLISLKDRFPRSAGPVQIEVFANAMSKVGIGSLPYFQKLIELALEPHHPAAQKWAQLTLIATLRNRYFVEANSGIGSMPSSIWSRFFFAGDPVGFRDPTLSELEFIYSAARTFLQPTQNEMTQTSGAVLITYLNDLKHPINEAEFPPREIHAILIRNALGRNHIVTRPFEMDFEFAQALLQK